MTSTFHSIETSKRSLFAQQAAMNTIGQNIANVDTEGYSRQRVNLTESRSIEAYGMTRSTVPGQLGTGVEFTSITRVRTTFLDDQFRDQNQALGNSEVQQDTLDKLQQIFNEPSDTGLRELVDKFWSSWSDLSNDPENLSGRTIVAQNAITLAQTMNQMSGLLDGLSSDLTTSVSLNADQINSFTSAIANLNTQIRKVESNGDNANDLRDQRDLYVDKLSNLVNVKVADGDQGYTVTMGGTELVNGDTATAVTADSLQSAYESGDLKGGSVYGAIYARDTYVADYTKQLDNIANTLANGDVVITLPKGTVMPEGSVVNEGTDDEITFSNANGNRTLDQDLTVTVKGLNGLHKLGYLPGVSPATTAGDFFVASDGGTVTAGNIKLNSDIAANPGLIATSLRTSTTTAADGTTTETVVSGNNTLASLMAGLKNSKFTMSGGSSNTVTNGTLDDYFQSLVGKLGVQAQAADTQLTNQQLLVDQADSNRQSVSGVSLDEEMADLLKFQHAYSSAARFMTTMDELLDKLINGTGMVGR